MDSLDLLKQYARDCEALICASETLSYKWGFKDYLQTGVAGVVMLDLSWCGGLTEARKIAGMADAWQLPVAPHDCTGPVVWAASTHLSLHAPNALIQESVRAFYTGWYRELVTELPSVKDGMITLGDKPGLGLELLPDLHKRAGCRGAGVVAAEPSMRRPRRRRQNLPQFTRQDDAPALGFAHCLQQRTRHGLDVDRTVVGGDQRSQPARDLLAHFFAAAHRLAEGGAVADQQRRAGRTPGCRIRGPTAPLPSRP